MSEDDEGRRAIVIDSGSDTVKAGYAGDDNPCRVFPTVLGRAKNVGLDLKEYYVGYEALRKRGILSMKYPVERGVVCDWDNMEKVTNFFLLIMRDEVCVVT